MTINENLAREAKQSYSFTDYVEGSATEGYNQQVSECFELANKAKERTEEQYHCKIDELVERYNEKLANWINKANSIETRCPSILITGGGNFPTKRKEAQNEARDKHYEAYKEIDMLLDKIRNYGTGNDIIKSNDVNALDLLQDKLNALTEKQESMKEANKACRGTYQSFELTNNNAKIKATRERIEAISKIKEQGEQEIVCAYCKIVQNTELMRLQLLFEGKPSDDVRTLLKKHGYKWAPSNSAWQRQLTANAKRDIKWLIEELEEKA